MDNICAHGALSKRHDFSNLVINFTSSNTITSTIAIQVDE